MALVQYLLNSCQPYGYMFFHSFCCCMDDIVTPNADTLLLLLLSFCVFENPFCDSCHKYVISHFWCTQSKCSAIGGRQNSVNYRTLIRTKVATYPFQQSISTLDWLAQKAPRAPEKSVSSESSQTLSQQRTTQLWKLTRNPLPLQEHSWPADGRDPSLWGS